MPISSKKYPCVQYRPGSTAGVAVYHRCLALLPVLNLDEAGRRPGKARREPVLSILSMTQLSSIGSSQLCNELVVRAVAGSGGASEFVGDGGFDPQLGAAPSVVTQDWGGVS